MNIIIAGTIRTGTSAVVKILLDNGCWTFNYDYENYATMKIPFKGKIKLGQKEYLDLENRDFNHIVKEGILGASNEKEKQQGIEKLRKFKESLPKNKHVVLKNPKASRCIQEVLEIFPQAKYIYVLRNPADYLKKVVRKELNWGILGWVTIPKYIRDWLWGYSAMMDIENLHIVSYERLLKFPKRETQELFEFLGIEKENIDISGIKKDK